MKRMEKDMNEEFGDLSNASIERLSELTSEIYVACELSSNSEVSLPASFLINKNAELQYLKDNGVICSYETPTSLVSGRLGDVDPIKGSVYKIAVDFEKLSNYVKEMKLSVKQVNKFGKYEYLATLGGDKSILINQIKVYRGPRVIENQIFIEYIFDNPNVKIYKESIEKKRGIIIDKSFHTIIDNLGFKKSDLRAAFFTEVKESSLIFNNPAFTQQPIYLKNQS